MNASSSMPARVGRALAAASLCGALAGASACDSLTGTPEREQAEVAVSALASAGNVTMVTSTVFSVVAGGEVLLLEADTQVVGLPFQNTFPLEGLNRFFVSVGPGTPGDTASVRMQVRIDGESWFDDERTLGADSLGTMTFVYRFSQPVL